MSRRALSLAALALVALIGAVAGCSNDDADTASSTNAANSEHAISDDSGTSADNQDQRVKFAECVRENGVSDFPDPNAKGEFVYGVSVSPAVWKQAVLACKELQPPGTLSAERTPEQQSAALEFAQCIRENGVKDFPDPANGEPLVDTTQIPGPDTPEAMSILNAAMAKCEAPVADDAAGGADEAAGG